LNRFLGGTAQKIRLDASSLCQVVNHNFHAKLDPTLPGAIHRLAVAFAMDDRWKAGQKIATVTASVASAPNSSLRFA
jgi:hypothetical protein